MIYLASPFSSPDKSIETSRYILTKEYVQRRLLRGIVLFSPIVYFYPLAHSLDLPKHFEFWKRINIEYLRRADSVEALCLPGWKESVGMQFELQLAADLNLPVSMVM